MIDKISQFLTDKIRQKDQEISEERAEIINYGIQIIIGEVPKVFIMLALAYILGVFKLSLISFLILLPYRGFSGGFHLKTHIGCIITTTSFYCGVALLAKNMVLTSINKYILIVLAMLFGIIMIKLYAPADTEDVPIISEKLRKQKRVLSYVTLIIGLIVALFINNSVISNVIIFGYLIQTVMITRFAYRLTNNKYGHEVYQDTSN